MAASVICVTCLRCRHRGVVDGDALARAGLPADVSIAAVSRLLVCQACGSRAMSVERRPADEAAVFVEG